MVDSSRIKIKMGPVEIEYEGTENFLKDELLDMVKAVSELYKEAGGNIQELAPKGGNGEKADSSNKGTGGSYKGTTNQIATRLGISKGADLIKAAGAKLHFVDGKESFGRNEILDEAKTAPSYYSETKHLKNLSSILQTLVKNDTFNEPSTDTYALTESAIKAIGAKLD